MTRIAPCVIAALALGLSACTNPYDPVQRGLGGGIFGAASGAAIGAAAGGGPGAALGAAIGGATGIFGGVASTPPPPWRRVFGLMFLWSVMAHGQSGRLACRTRAWSSLTTEQTRPTTGLQSTS